MEKTQTLSVSLNRRDAARVNQMAATLSIPVSEFLGRAVDHWLERPKRFKKLAKDIVKDQKKSLKGKAGETQVAATKKRVKALTKKLKEMQAK